MLSVTFEKKERIVLSEFESLTLYELIRDERYFRIDINGRTFYEDPVFPFLEFVKYCIDWKKSIYRRKKNKCVDFIYETIESEDNPHLAFYQKNGKWFIDSVWKRFDYSNSIDFGEIEALIDKVICETID